MHPLRQRRPRFQLGKAGRTASTVCLRMCSRSPTGHSHDLFDLMQSRSHIENLARRYGMGEGLVHVASTSTIGSSTIASLDSMASGCSRSKNQTSITFTAISVAASNDSLCPDLDADIYSNLLLRYFGDNVFAFPPLLYIRCAPAADSATPNTPATWRLSMNP
ncbi:hypothetical protein EDC04DRAFT_981545 [Pisolithus marmoratus]|nr:hypothetical protein EDC04DRAFT_981545 [Pisolithus marmoratus]